MNEKYGSTYTRGQLLHYFVDIRKRGLREKVYLRDLKEKNSTPRLLTPSMEKGLKIVTEYGSIMEDCRKKGVTIPPKSEIKSALAKKHGISLEKLDQYIRVGRRARNDIGAGKFVPPDDYDDNTFFY